MSATQSLPSCARRQVISVGSTTAPSACSRASHLREPPIGSLRWKPPVPKSRLQGSVRCHRVSGRPAISRPSKLNHIYANEPWPMSEDCLSLNIWTPAKAKKAPVFVWIYGGALWSGTSREPLYDGRRLAERGMIVVSINYRARRARLARASRAQQGIDGRHFRQLRPDGSDCRIALGPAKHRGVRRRSRQRHNCRRIRGRAQRDVPDGLAARSRAVSPRRSPKAPT